MMTESTKDLVSIGHLAGVVQRSVRAIEKAATGLGMQPALRLNGIAHFDGEQVEAITKALTQTPKPPTPLA